MKPLRSARLLPALAVVGLHAGLLVLGLRALPRPTGPVEGASVPVLLLRAAPAPQAVPSPALAAAPPRPASLSTGRPQGAVSSAAAPSPVPPTGAGDGVEPEPQAAAQGPQELAVASPVPLPVEPLEPARRAACAPVPHPPLLRERGIEGVVRLRVWVDELGRAGEVLLTASSGFRLFDEAAMAQVRHCPFQPARRGQTAQASWVEFAVRFALKQGEPSDG